MRESWVESAVTQYARLQGWTSIKLNGPGGRGKPDRLFLSEGGKVKFIEFKGRGGRLTKLQRNWLQRLETMGFECHCIDNIERGKRLFD